MSVISGISGISGIRGISGQDVLTPGALTLSCAAIVGPYAGTTLQTKEPPFDKPGNLALWADGPLITACFTELVEGLLFDTDASRKQATLAHISLRGGRLQTKRLVTLRAPLKAQFKKQAELVAAYADLRPDRAAHHQRGRHMVGPRPGAGHLEPVRALLTTTARPGRRASAAPQREKAA